MKATEPARAVPGSRVDVAPPALASTLALVAAALSFVGCAGKAADATADAGGDAPVRAGPCAPPADPKSPAPKLSETGCMDATHPTELASIVTPYEVNSPLWSDGADKARGFVLPAGQKIHVKDCAAPSPECTQGTQDTGKWVMPVGTVMVKSFSFDGKLVETRLLVHADADTWNGYSYAWNEAQTDATVVPDDDDPSLGGARTQVAFDTGARSVTWTYPYRLDCTTCHTQSAGGTLGPETRQMNRVVGGANQIDRWKTLGLFDDTAPAAPYQDALVLPYDGQLGTVPAGAMVEQRARSYLHANCAYCHRPDGDFTSLDFRYDTALADMGACGVTPMKGDVGVTGALVLAPGTPMKSAMWLRMDAPPSTGKTRMPQLATYVIDAAGVALVGDWITSIAMCP